MAAVGNNDRVTIVRFEGVGASDGGAVPQYTYRTPGADLSYTDDATTVSALANHPTVAPARLDPLDAIGVGGGVTLDLLYLNTNALVTALARRTITPLKGALNEDVYTTAYLASTDTSTVLGSDVSSVLNVNDLIWIGTNTALVTSVSTSTVGITLGQLGAPAQDVPHVGEGVLVFTSWPDLVGRRVTISESDATVASKAAETIIYRGVVDAVVPDGPRLTIRTSSRMQQMFGDGGRKFYPPQSTGETLGYPLRDAGSVVAGSWDYPKDTLWGDPTWVYHRLLHSDGKWAVVKMTSSVPVGLDQTVRRYAPDTDGANIVQMGQDEEVYSVDRWDELWEDGTGWGSVSAEYAWVAEDQTPSSVLLDLLQGADLPWSVCMRMHDDEIDAAAIASRVDLASDMIRLNSPGVPGRFGNLFVMPRFKPSDKRIADLCAEEILGPLALALAPDKQGVVTAVDFRQTFFRDATVVDSDIKSGPIGATPRSSKTVVREWSYSAGIAGVADETVYSVVATMIHGGGKKKKYDLRIMASAWNMIALRNRAQALSSTFERSVPEGGFSVGSDVDADVGSLLEVTCASLPGDDGVRGSGTQRFFVTEWGRDPGGPPKLRGLFFGSDTGAKWAPAARASGYLAGKVSVYAQIFTDPDETDVDSDKFAVGDYVILLDQYGAIKTAPKEITAITTGKLTVAHSAAVDGDYLILADYDITPHDNDWTWLGDDSARLGAANDISPVWT